MKTIKAEDPIQTETEPTLKTGQITQTPAIDSKIKWTRVADLNNTKHDAVCNQQTLQPIVASKYSYVTVRIDVWTRAKKRTSEGAKSTLDARTVRPNRKKALDFDPVVKRAREARSWFRAMV